jgi:hypothetical protein
MTNLYNIYEDEPEDCGAASEEGVAFCVMKLCIDPS